MGRHRPSARRGEHATRDSWGARSEETVTYFGRSLQKGVGAVAKTCRMSSPPSELTGTHSGGCQIDIIRVRQGKAWEALYCDRTKMGRQRTARCGRVVSGATVLSFITPPQFNVLYVRVIGRLHFGYPGTAAIHERGRVAQA